MNNLLGKGGGLIGNRIKWNAETGHDPCGFCAGPVLRRENQSEFGWKRTAYCSNDCQRMAERDRLHPDQKPHPDTPPKQLHAWPVVPRYNSLEPGDNLVARYDTPANYIGIGSSAGACRDDPDADLV